MLAVEHNEFNGWMLSDASVIHFVFQQTSRWYYTIRDQFHYDNALRDTKWPHIIALLYVYTYITEYAMIKGYWLFFNPEIASTASYHWDTA
jgi:hypothetical protein